MITLSNVIGYNEMTITVFKNATNVSLTVSPADNLHFYSFMESKWNPNVEGNFEPETIWWAIYDKKTRQVVECGKTIAPHWSEYCHMRGTSLRGHRFSKYFNCAKVADNKKPLIGGIEEIITRLNQELEYSKKH